MSDDYPNDLDSADELPESAQTDARTENDPIDEWDGTDVSQLADTNETGPDMAKFASGVLLIVGGLLCMTLVGGVIGFPMVLLGYWIYKKYDVEFEVAK